MSDLYDALEYGPIVYPCFKAASKARDEQPMSSKAFITINGAYLNLWVGDSYGYQNTDCRYVGDTIGEWSLNDIIEKAKDYYNDIMLMGACEMCEQVDCNNENCGPCGSCEDFDEICEQCNWGENCCCPC